MALRTAETTARIIKRAREDYAKKHALALYEFVEDLSRGYGCKTVGCRCIGGTKTHCDVAEARLLLELMSKGEA